MDIAAPMHIAACGWLMRSSAKYLESLTSKDHAILFDVEAMISGKDQGYRAECHVQDCPAK
jgi:hypothetical protein